MPPDPIRLADTAAWLSKARLDLRVEPPPDRVTPILALAKEDVEAIATRIDETSR